MWKNKLPVVSIKSSAIDVAIQYLDLPLRETWANNRSSYIDALVRYVGHSVPLNPKAAGLPYCAIGVSACFLMAQRAYIKGGGDTKSFTELMIKTASSQEIKRFFERKGLLFTDPQQLRQCKGALFGWTNSDAAHGHVGFVAGRLTDGMGKVVAIRTVEFNSNMAGSRDGEGCYSLIRQHLHNGVFGVKGLTGNLGQSKKKLWFCDTSSFFGGSWWA